MALFNKKTKTETLASYLDNTGKQSLSSKIINLLGGTITNFDELYENLLVYLIQADFGVETSEEIVDQLKEEVLNEFAPNRKFVLDTLARLLIEQYEDKPMVSESFIMFVGINGSGKTTTISKVANYYLKQGKTVGLIAADTFRAGAVSQLQMWADRLHIHCVTGKENADPSSVLVDGCRYYKEHPVDVVLADTAGRLQNKANLMKELNKMVRVTKRELGVDKFEILLTLDSTIGQNSLFQAEAFLESSDVTGVVLTKMDGTSKGGVVIPINKKFKLPVRYMTFGENIEAIEEFDIESYVNALIKGE